MRLPAVIGKYRIEEYLGGGMAEVYRAEDSVLGRRVAFKQLSPAGVADEAVRARFLEEARVGGQLSHDNIVRTFDYGDDHGQPFIVMELLEGKSLATRIKAGDLGDFRERARIALEIARALQYLHARQILHRAIKPDNVHIEAVTGRVRLIDFGIAKSQGMNLTQAGFVVGTPFYMAPEQLMGTPIGPATDIYAFGLVFFEVLTGRRARPADTVERVLQQIINDPVDCGPLAECGVPEPLAAIVRDATQSDTSRRTADFGVIVPQLENWIESQKAATAPTVILRPTARRLQLSHTLMAGAVAAVVCGLVVGLLGVSVARARLPQGRAMVMPVDEMAAIPGGVFEFEQDRRKMNLAAFQIDRREVTNEQFAAFCRLKHRALPNGFHEDWPGQPVTGVTIDDARAYCFAQSKHLPTEMQWERAARGTTGARFPWGNDSDESRANCERGRGHLVSADSMKSGASPEGVLHMIGNAAEWVDQPLQPSLLALEKFANILKPPATDGEPWYMIKGGSFRRSVAQSAADLWLPAPGRYTADDVGFRCAK